MKKLLCSAIVALLAAGTIVYTGCKKKSDSTATPTYTCTSCTTTPEAKAAFDNSSKGVYKGIIVGSSGTIKFDIGNGDSTIKAYMVIDGTAVTLTASVAWTSGTAYVSPFGGTLNGQPVSITFSVGADGANPTIVAMNIPGHANATLELSKETSSNLIKCFEGSYKSSTNSKTGTFNMVLSTSLNKWGARTRDDGSTDYGSVEGTLNNGLLNFDDGKGATGSAKLTGDNITDGTWKSANDNGTWEAKRTL